MNLPDLGPLPGPDPHHPARYTDDQVVTYDVARDCIGALIASHTAELHRLAQQGVQDGGDGGDGDTLSQAGKRRARCEELEARISALFRERRALLPGQGWQIERIRREYGAQVRTAALLQRIREAGSPRQD